MLPRVFFWLLVGLHLWKVVQTLLYAEDLERAKRANTDVVHPWRRPAKILAASALYFSGFYYARFPWVWLALSVAMLVSGLFALLLAAGFRNSGFTGEMLIPEHEIELRAARRRRLTVAQLVLLAAWTYAWRDVVSPLWPSQ